MARVHRINAVPVGPSRASSLLQGGSVSDEQDQKIAASGSSYIERVRPLIRITHNPRRSCRRLRSFDSAVALLCFALAFDVDLLPLSQRPNAGVAQGATRHGCRVSRPRPWMADGGGPPEQCRSEGMPSLSEAPNGGAKRFGSFWAFAKGTRCKSETASRHNRSNGYAPNPN